ncbi:hypothetical protein AHAS_Ahas14G0144900 [Arachis hypogaea]
MLFSKGGWELDESKKEAALRETIEEAGVRGIAGFVYCRVNWGNGASRAKPMIPSMKGTLEFWPEQNIRQRTWVSTCAIN